MCSAMARRMGDSARCSSVVATGAAADAAGTGWAGGRSARAGEAAGLWAGQLRYLVANDGHVGLDGRGRAFRKQDLLQNAGDGAGHLRVDFVRLDLDQWLVALDAVARLLQPPSDGALRDRLAELRQF